MTATGLLNYWPLARRCSGGQHSATRGGVAKILDAAAKRLAILLFFALFFSSPTFGEEGCPPGQFPFLSGCKQVSKYDRIKSADEPMTFVGRQEGMAFLWVAAEGIITEDTPEQFEKFLKSYDGKIVKTIIFHSPGGNLGAAIKLGKLIRQAGYRTFIGRSISLDEAMAIYHYKDAHCLSACAYAFLGGVERSYTEKDSYGLHRFGKSDRDIGGDVAQIITSELATYVEQMGVDQRVLRLASSADFGSSMQLVPVSVAKQLRIIFNPDDVGDFTIEEFKGRASARTRIYYRLSYFEALLHCSNGPLELTIWGNRSQFSDLLIGLNNAPTLFEGNKEGLRGTLSSGLTSDGKFAFLTYRIMSLDWRHFQGDGLRITQIANPHLAQLPSKLDPKNAKQVEDFYKRVMWADATMSVSFSIRARNASRTIPLVLRDCRK